MPLAEIPDFIMDVIVPKAQPLRIPSPLESNSTEENDIRNALDSIPPDCSYQDWMNNGQALHSWNSMAGLSIWNAWSSQGSKYKSGECAAKWKTFKSEKGITIATLFGIAKDNGFK